MKKRAALLYHHINKKCYWTVLIIVLVMLIITDTFRAPSVQITSRFFIIAVKTYQIHLSPLLSAYVKCRFTPTCSEFAKIAVERYGIRKGIVLTFNRLLSCKPSVLFGTPTPVP